MKTYSELKKLKTFEERFEYVKEGSRVGEETFGYDRYLNQKFYNSKQWKDVRSKAIIRDNACDLGIDGREIPKYAIVHHLNAVTEEQIINRDPILFDLDNLITVSDRTHRALTYGDEDQLYKEPVERKQGDTCPWKAS